MSLDRFTQPCEALLEVDTWEVGEVHCPPVLSCPNLAGVVRVQGTGEAASWESMCLGEFRTFWSNPCPQTMLDKLELQFPWIVWLIQLPRTPI